MSFSALIILWFYDSMKWYPVVNMQDFTQKKVFCYLGKLPVLRGLGKECYGWEGRGYPFNGTGFIASHTCFSNQSRQGSALCSVLCLLVWWGCCTAVSSEHLPACQNQFSSSTNTTWDSLSFDFFFLWSWSEVYIYLPPCSNPLKWDLDVFMKSSVLYGEKKSKGLSCKCLLLPPGLALFFCFPTVKSWLRSESPAGTSTAEQTT